MAKIDLPSAIDADFLGELSTRLGLKTDTARESLHYFLRNAILLDRKHQDYGPRNISEWGMMGVLFKINDKYQRLKTLIGSGRRKRPQTDKVRDSFQDTCNYAVIGEMLLDSKWPME